MGTKMLVEELATAAREIRRTTTGYPHRVAHMMCYWLERCQPYEDPVDMIRGMITDILAELEVQWNRAEDAPGWPDEDDGGDENDET